MKRGVTVKIKLILTFAVFLLQPALAAAQQTESSPDAAALRQIVQYYFEGWQKDDPNLISKAFHPKAKLFAISDKNDLKEITRNQVQDALKSNLRRKVPKVEAILKVNSIDVTGGVAFVKIEIDYSGQSQSAKTTEYLSLIKFPDEGWKIVSRVSAVENKQSTPK
jgi:hypothetical protein